MENPKIRFKGFTKDWEQRKLIDYLEVSSEKNRDNRFTKEDVLSVSGEYGIVNQIEFQGRSFAGASVSNYGVVENGDVVYTKSPLKSNPYGIIKTNKGIPGIVSTLYAVYKPKEITDSKFVQIYFELDSRMNSYMHPLVNKGAKNDMKVSAENALKGMVSFPKKDEQEMISLYFSTIDHLITLHQRKCEQTKKLKKYMLQKMFPQNGAKVPEIRFYGFTYDWEQRKLGEIATETYGGGTPKTSNEEFWKGDIPWIQSSDLIDECLFDVRPRKCISQEAVSKSATKLVPQNSIAIVTRVGVGKLAFMPFSYATSQDFLSLSGLKIDPEFTVYALYKMMQSVSNEVQGTSIKGVTKDELLAKKIIFPSCNEQKKIGAYLHSLDNLITLHQRKCDELKKMKKYMLQNMFI
jgi:type I restriction enzyme S subunit